MADRADEIAEIKVGLEEQRTALEPIRANPNLTEDERTLLEVGIRREILVLEIRLRESILGGR
jgi:hypothetical protein